MVNTITNQNLILPGGTAKIGSFEYQVDMNGALRDRWMDRTTFNQERGGFDSSTFTDVASSCATDSRHRQYCLSRRVARVC